MTRALRGQRRDLLLAVLLLAVLAAAGATRALLPIDETRHAAVAWEMWSRGELLLPVLNGQPYAEQSPLLFWLMHAGWAVFGVNAWWPRCIAPLFAAGTLALVLLLARHLWPARPAVARVAPFVLLTTLPYTWFATALVLDVVLVFFVVLGWLGLVVAWRVPKSASGYMLLGAGLTGALYARGPAAWLLVLPPVVFAPWWMRRHHPPWILWAAGVGAALAAAALLMLIWAVPATQAGGAAYGEALFWGPAAGRRADPLAPAAPGTTRLLALLLMLAPWFLWPRWWRGLRHMAPGDAGLRFVFGTALLALAAWWLAGGRRPQDLLPGCVLWALMLSRALEMAPPPGRWAAAMPAALLALGGLLALAVVPGLVQRWDPQADVLALRLAGGAVVVLAAVLAWRPSAGNVADVHRIAVSTTLSLALLSVAAGPLLDRTHDVGDVAARLSRWQREGRPLGVQGQAQGQWTFAGRLTQPLQRVERDDAVAWLKRHPRGRSIVFYRQPDELPAGAQVVHRQRYRGGWLAILARVGEKVDTP